MKQMPEVSTKISYIASSPVLRSRHVKELLPYLAGSKMPPVTILLQLCMERLMIIRAHIGTAALLAGTVCNAADP
jgi:hypothetical protein